MGDFVYELNRLAGTDGLEAAGAANAWAGTTGKELVGALNAKAGTTGLELLGALNKIANTTGLDAVAALQSVCEFSDSFTRADSALTLGSTDSAYGGTSVAWAALAGTWGISSNRAYCATSTDQGTAAIQSGLANCTIRCTVAVVGADSGIIWRVVDASNYFVWTSGGTVYRQQGGSFNSVSAGGAIPAGGVCTVALSGNAHTIYVNGVQIATFTDAFQNTATKHGIRASSSITARFDDFKVRR